jgi:hypothetical protein
LKGNKGVRAWMRREKKIEIIKGKQNIPVVSQF